MLGMLKPVVISVRLKGIALIKGPLRSNSTMSAVYFLSEYFILTSKSFYAVILVWYAAKALLINFLRARDLICPAELMAT